MSFGLNLVADPKKTPCYSASQGQHVAGKWKNLSARTTPYDTKCSLRHAQGRSRDFRSIRGGVTGFSNSVHSGLATKSKRPVFHVYGNASNSLFSKYAKEYNALCMLVPNEVVLSKDLFPDDKVSEVFNKLSELRTKVKGFVSQAQNDQVKTGLFQLLGFMEYQMAQIIFRISQGSVKRETMVIKLANKFLSMDDVNNVQSFESVNTVKMALASGINAAVFFFKFQKYQGFSSEILKNKIAYLEEMESLIKKHDCKVEGKIYTDLYLFLCVLHSMNYDYSSAKEFLSRLCNLDDSYYFENVLRTVSVVCDRGVNGESVSNDLIENRIKGLNEAGGGFCENSDDLFSNISSLVSLVRIRCCQWENKIVELFFNDDFCLKNLHAYRAVRCLEKKCYDSIIWILNRLLECSKDHFGSAMLDVISEIENIVVKFPSGESKGAYLVEFNNLINSFLFWTHYNKYFKKNKQRLALYQRIMEMRSLSKRNRDSIRLYRSIVYRKADDLDSSTHELNKVLETRSVEYLCEKFIVELSKGSKIDTLIPLLDRAESLIQNESEGCSRRKLYVYNKRKAQLWHRVATHWYQDSSIRRKYRGLTKRKAIEEGVSCAQRCLDYSKYKDAGKSEYSFPSSEHRARSLIKKLESLKAN